jgi:hypothetical protein
MQKEMDLWTIHPPKHPGFYLYAIKFPQYMEHTHMEFTLIEVFERPSDSGELLAQEPGGRLWDINDMYGINSQIKGIWSRNPVMLNAISAADFDSIIENVGV